MESLFNKAAGLTPATLLKRVSNKVFSCEICKYFRNTFFIEHLWWLLLLDDKKQYSILHSSKLRYNYCRANCMADLIFSCAIPCLARAEKIVKFVSIKPLLRCFIKNGAHAVQDRRKVSGIGGDKIHKRHL